MGEYDKLLLHNSQVQSQGGIGMYKYHIIIYWDNRDKCYIADVPELSGCKAHGASYEKALLKAKEAIALWIDHCQRVWRPDSSAKRTPIAVRVNKGKHGCPAKLLLHLS
jgi:predicted RNase H-like HicB family nuclease